MVSPRTACVLAMRCPVLRYDTAPTVCAVSGSHTAKNAPHLCSLLRDVRHCQGDSCSSVSTRQASAPGSDLVRWFHKPLARSTHSCLALTMDRARAQGVFAGGGFVADGAGGLCARAARLRRRNVCRPTRARSLLRSARGPLHPSGV
eukprot:3760496-Rhodomonas_salina.2